VLDSWERLGKENDKLMDPFYSAFANAVAEQGISRVTLGVGSNKQITTPFMRDVVVRFCRICETHSALINKTKILDVMQPLTF